MQSLSIAVKTVRAKCVFEPRDAYLIEEKGVIGGGGGACLHNHEDIRYWP